MRWWRSAGRGASRGSPAPIFPPPRTKWLPITTDAWASSGSVPINPAPTSPAPSNGSTGSPRTIRRSTASSTVPILMQELIPQLESIFRDVFNDPRLVIKPETVASDVPDWDSLTNINLIFAIESEFKVRFALGEIQELKNVSEMAALIMKKKGLAKS